jgi:hypothetical protein
MARRKLKYNEGILTILDIHNEKTLNSICSDSDHIMLDADVCDNDSSIRVTVRDQSAKLCEFTHLDPGLSRTIPLQNIECETVEVLIGELVVTSFYLL